MSMFSTIGSSQQKPWETHLAIDVMYFHAARQAYARAKTAQDGIQEAENHWNTLEVEEEEILDKYNGDSYAAYDELEPICIQMEDAHYQIGAARAPLLKEFAVVHILTSACLEAHINSLARESLAGIELDAFEWLALSAKWLFLPKMVGCVGFEPGYQPFQRFSKLLKYRNELIHYKGIKEEWVYGAVPEFLSKLGLTLSEAEQSLKAVEEMIGELAKQRGLDRPYWLRADLNEMNYFEILTE